ncbi:MAG: hypothetical protein HQK96_11930 [Nitrospirae bacterium]|nr:hypothetical protein [Nitrospirota bacterium]
MLHEHPASADRPLDESASDVPQGETPVKPPEENNPDILMRLKDNKDVSELLL